MASANHPKGIGEDRRVPNPDKSNTASRGMAEQPAGNGSGNPEAPDDLPAAMPARRPNDKDPTDTGRLPS